MIYLIEKDGSDRSILIESYVDTRGQLKERPIMAGDPADIEKAFAELVAGGDGMGV